MITDLHTFGFDKEITLKTRIDDAIGEQSQKTNERYAQFDYLSENFYIELKSRRRTDRYGRLLLPDSNQTWLLPASKAPKKADKETVFFYYFEADDSLWYLQYDEELFNTFTKEIPGWHPSGQTHWYIPKDVWTKLD